MKFKIMISLLVLVLCGCNTGNTDEPSIELGVRFSLESGNNQNIQVKVFLEGPDGDLVTGSSVVVMNSSGVTSLLSFSYNEGCYSGSAAVSVDGRYILQINSSLLDQVYTQSIDHFLLKERTEVTLLQNSDGTSALTGSSLAAGEDIQLGWEMNGAATIYQVALYKSGTLCYIQSVENETLIIPGEILDGTGVYSCQVNSQYIAGDPLFLSHNYYSFSEISGQSVTFYLE